MKAYTSKAVGGIVVLSVLLIYSKKTDGQLSGAQFEHSHEIFEFVKSHLQS
jgi:hypothetical protein